MQPCVKLGKCLTFLLHQNRGPLLQGICSKKWVRTCSSISLQPQRGRGVSRMHSFPKSSAPCGLWCVEVIKPQAHSGFCCSQCFRRLASLLSDRSRKSNYAQILVPRGTLLNTWEGFDPRRTGGYCRWPPESSVCNFFFSRRRKCELLLRQHSPL